MMKFKDLKSVNEQDFILDKAMEKLEKEVKKAIKDPRPVEIQARCDGTHIDVVVGKVDKPKKYFQIDLDEVVEEYEELLWEF
jgi:hypothetical protein